MSGIDISSISVDHTTMGGMLRWHAAHRPAEVAVVCAGKTRTWADLNSSVNRCANALLALGLSYGENVAAMLTNRLEYLDVYLACAKTGLSVTPINYHLAGAEVAHVVNNSGAKVLIHDAAKAPLIRDLVETGAIRIAEDRVLEVSEAVSSFGSLISTVSDSEPDSPQITGEETFFIGYTSGTTGLPKGCVQKHRKFTEHYRLAAAVYPHRPGEIMLIPGPLFHEAPTLFTLAHLYMGGTIVLMQSFDPTEALLQVQKHQCTSIGFGVPTMLDRMCDIGQITDTSSVKMITTGGAPLHAETMERTLNLFANAELHEFYGATEIGLVTDIRHRAEGRAGSCGRPVQGVSVAVIDDAGMPVASGEKGGVYVTPLLMEGYLGNDIATQAGTVVRNGVKWFTLDDIGFIDDEGFLHLVDRKSHMIISGAENIYPAEVEAVLTEHPLIDDVAVVGAPDAKWGETVVAVIVTQDDSLSLEDIRSFLDGRLAKYKWPRQIRRIDELPRTLSGKIQKHRIDISVL